MHSSIEELKNNINNTLEGIQEPVNIFGHINKETLKSKLKRLEKIEDILEKDKYNITFIGTVGAGKTTAISHLFNLVHNVKKTIERRGKKREFEVVEPLLSTGSGRTTICEVEIKPSKKLFMEIEPYTREELIEEIKYFCDSFYKSNSEDDSKGSSISEELERATRSIIGLKKNVKDNNDDKVDEAEKKAKELSREEFIKYAIEKSNLNNRVYTQEESKIFCTSEEPKKWIKENFEKLNKGRFPTQSIPKKIFIYINQDIVGDSFSYSFNSIIDTKGIDENPIREDLVNQIEDENTIVIFTSSYNDAPKSDIRELIEYALSKKSKRYEDRFILLVMPRNNEPENENDGDGSWENGIELKKDIIKKVFRDKKLNFKSENILFYDALHFFDTYGRIDRDYDEEDIQDEKDELVQNIENIIEQRKENLKNEVNEIEQSLCNVRTGNVELTDKEKEKIEDLYNQLITIKDISKRVPSYVYEDFINSYINYYSTNYKAWNTKDAIHRRFGVFPERGYSTYYDAKIVAEGKEDEMLHKFTKDLKIEVIESLQKLGSSVGSLETLIHEIVKLFEIEYDKFIDTVGTELYNFLEKENKNREFWEEFIDRRGKGRGYNDDVARMLKNNLRTLRNGLSIDGIFQYYVEKEWEKLIDKILIFFKN